MRIRYKAFKAVEDWPYIKDRAEPDLVEDTCGIIAIDIDSGQRVAAAIFDHLTEGSAQVHIMADTPMVLRHGFLEEAADFIFNFMGKNVVFGFTPANNTKALKFNQCAAGFKEVYRVPNGFKPGVDWVIMQLLKEECSYLPRIQEDVKYG